MGTLPKQMELKCEKDLLKMHLSLFIIVPVICILIFVLSGYKFDYIGTLATIIAFSVFTVLNLIKCLEVGIRIRYLKAP